MPSYETTAAELDHYYRREPRWGGALPRDLLPAKLGERMFIVNLQPSTQGSGTHWTALFDCDPTFVSYFDSEGEPDPPRDVLQRMTATGKRMVFSRSWVQAFTSDACGLFCVYYLNRLLAGEAPERVVVDELKPTQWAANQRVVLRGTRGVLP